MRIGAKRSSRHRPFDHTRPLAPRQACRAEQWPWLAKPLLIFTRPPSPDAIWGLVRGAAFQAFRDSFSVTLDFACSCVDVCLGVSSHRAPTSNKGGWGSGCEGVRVSSLTKPEPTSLQVARIRAKSTRPRSGRGTREACVSFVWLAPEGASHPKVTSPLSCPPTLAGPNDHTLEDC